MTALNRSRHLTPRLVLIFAVLACVFGWGHSSASAENHHVSEIPAASIAPISPDFTLAEPGDAAHADEHTGSPTMQPLVAESSMPMGTSPSSPMPVNHPAGHGHDHAASCMATSAASAFGVIGMILTPFVSGLPTELPDLVHASRAGVGADPPARPPSISVLCVQRT